MPLEGQVDQAIEQLGIGDPGGLEKLGVDARLGEPGDRVDLVHHDLAVRAHEEVDSRHPLALGGDERVDGDLLDACGGIGGNPGRDDQLHPTVVVLRRVVVPLGFGDDLADDRHGRLAVAEDAALDFRP